MLRESFNPEKFIEQCKAHAIRCGYPTEAEDFAQFAFLQVWKYQHYQPMIWNWSRYLATQFGSTHSETGRIKSQSRRFDGNGDALLEDGENFIDTFVAAPEQDREQKEKLTIVSEFFQLMERLPSRNCVRKLRKIYPLQTDEFRQMISELEPLQIEWIRI